MDGTLIIEESLDELAEFLGFTHVVVDPIKQAMQGDLSFEISIRGRVKWLTGMRHELLESCFQDRISLSDGAETLMKTMNGRNAFKAIASGGLKYFALIKFIKLLKYGHFFNVRWGEQNGNNTI